MSAIATDVNSSVLFPVSVEQADPERDRIEIQGVWDRGLGPGPYRLAFYLNNPVAPGRIWRLNDACGRLVGALGAHARRFLVEGRHCTIGEIGNLAVDPEFRSGGPAVKLQRAYLDSLEPAGQPFAIGATAKAGAVLKRSGCQELGPVQRWVKPLRTGSRLGVTLRHPWLGRCAGQFVDAALRWTARETYAACPRELTCEVVERFDARFDDLWQRSLCQFGITGERTAAYLNWRFLRCPDEQPRIFCVVQNDRLLGYVVAFLTNGTLEITDILYERIEVLDVLLAQFLRQVHRDNRVKNVELELFGASELIQMLRRFGFHRRACAVRFYISRPAERIPRDVLFDEKRWYLTGADLNY